jgi:hypothetical protein
MMCNFHHKIVSPKNSLFLLPLYLFFVVPRIELRASCVLGKCPTTDLYLQPKLYFLFQVPFAIAQYIWNFPHFPF